MPDIFDASALNSEPSSSEVTSTFESEPVSESGAEPAAASSTSRIMRNVDEYSETMRDEKSSNGVFKSFLPKPEKVFFASQHREETVLLLLRRHPITQVPWILAAIVLALLPFLFSSVGLLDFLPANFQLAATVGWYLLIISFVLESFISWFYNVYIITDERVIDVDFVNLLYKNISSAKIDAIEDITTISGGVLSSVFNFGTIKIQTSAAVTEFEFEDVPQPAKVTAFLNDMMVEEEREKIEGRVN
jgi:hypothetical protein